MAIMEQEPGAIARVYAGQGGYAHEVIKAIIDRYPTALATVKNAEEALNEPLLKQITSPRDPVKTTSRLDQLRLYVANAAIESVADERGLIPVRKTFVVGLSAGEQSAGRDFYTFEEGLEIVSVRGEEMDEANRLHRGTMSVVIGVPFEQVEADLVAAGIDPLEAEAVNDNPGTQTVIAGSEEGLRDVDDFYRQDPRYGDTLRVIATGIVGAAHTWRNSPAAAGFGKKLDEVAMSEPVRKFMGNQAQLIETAAALKLHFREQISRGVKLRQSVHLLVEKYGVQTMYTIESGRVMAGLLKREFRRHVNVVAVSELLLPKNQ